MHSIESGCLTGFNASSSSSSSIFFCWPCLPCVYLCDSVLLHQPHYFKALCLLLFSDWCRSYLTPVRDDEAESQRKAKSRHARQTRRSTQVKNKRRTEVWLSLDCVWPLKLCECPAGCDSDRSERGQADQQPVSSGQAGGGRRHPGWEVMCEERLDRWQERQDRPDRVHGNKRDQCEMEQTGWGQRDKCIQESVQASSLQVDVCDSSFTSVFFSCTYSRGTLNPG